MSGIDFKELADKLDLLIGEFLDQPNDKTDLVEFFWDNKIGILRGLQALAAQQGGAWRTDMENAPKDRPYLVEEEDDGRIQYHVARHTGANQSILVVGGHFAFDCGRLTRWREFDLPRVEQGVPE